MGWQNILQQNAIEIFHGFYFLTFLLEFVLPQEIQPTVIFILLQEDTEVKRLEVTALFQLQTPHRASLFLKENLILKTQHMFKTLVPFGMGISSL